MWSSIDEWRRHHYGAIRTGDLQLSVDLVADALVHHPHGRIRGVVLAGHALNLYLTARISEAHTAIRQALPLLEGDDLLHALLTALAVAETAGFMAAGQEYACDLCSLISQYPTERLEPWRGRVLLALACHYRLNGRYQAAFHWAHESIRWHQANTGPYDEADRLCYLRLSFITRAESHLGQGDVSGAMAGYLAALDVSPTVLPALDELAAHVALATGDSDGACLAAIRLEQAGGEFARTVAARIHTHIVRQRQEAVHSSLLGRTARSAGSPRLEGAARGGRPAGMRRSGVPLIPG